MLCRLNPWCCLRRSGESHGYRAGWACWCSVGPTGRRGCGRSAFCRVATTAADQCKLIEVPFCAFPLGPAAGQPLLIFLSSLPVDPFLPIFPFSLPVFPFFQSSLSVFHSSPQFWPEAGQPLPNLPFFQSSLPLLPSSQSALPFPSSQFFQSSLSSNLPFLSSNLPFHSSNLPFLPILASNRATSSNRPFLSISTHPFPFPACLSYSQAPGPAAAAGC